MIPMFDSKPFLILKTIFKKKALWVILLFSFVCEAKTSASVLVVRPLEQIKPLILAKNDKNMNKRRVQTAGKLTKRQRYGRKKSFKPASVSRQRRRVRKSLLLSVSEYERLPRPARLKYIKKIRKAYLWFEFQSGYDKLQGFPERNKQALYFLFPLLIPQAEAADFARKCLVGGVMRNKTASGKCPVYGRRCGGSSRNFKCGVAFNNVCISIQPVSDLSKRCYDQSKNKELNAKGYEKWKEFFDKTVPKYCEQFESGGSKTHHGCQYLTEKLKQFKREAKEPSETDSPLDGKEVTATSSDSKEQGVSEAQTKTEAAAICTECAQDSTDPTFLKLKEVIKAFEFLPVCERTKQVKEEIIQSMTQGRGSVCYYYYYSKKPPVHYGKTKSYSDCIKKYSECENITAADLLEFEALSLSEIKSLKPGDFSGFSNLKHLSIWGDLKELHPDQFKQNTKLESLNLFGNDLTSLHPDQFKHNTKLESLNLLGNDLTSLYPDQFKHNTQLKDLNLRGNRLKQLHPDQFKHNTQLTMLDMGWNLNLTSLHPDQFKHNTQLTTLDMGMNNLRNLHPDQFKHNTKLESLDLGSYLARLHENQFQHNTKLVTLKTGRIRDIPPKLLEPLKELQVLEVTSNSENQLPPDFLDQNRKLRSLTISSNAKLPEKLLSGKPNLQNLSLELDSSAQLSENLLSGKPNLQKFSLKLDTVKELPVNLLKDAPRVTSLNLSSRDLEDISMDFFSGLSNLRYVQLNRYGFSSETAENHFREDLKRKHAQLEEISFYSGAQSYSFGSDGSSCLSRRCNLPE